MFLDEELLERVAHDGSMDYDRWPEQLEPLIQRLDEIVSEFPLPKIPPDSKAAYTSPPSPFHDSLHSSNKENAPPPPPPAFNHGSATTTSELPSEGQAGGLNSQTSPNDPNSLPPPLVSLLDAIKSTLRTFFVTKPPHTVQRLAELILRPKRQYRTLPAYLRAVDRVVSVSSSADIFPLPRAGIAADDELVNGMTNGARSSFMVTDESLGSDESLGGALLTPIPWLRNHDLEAVQAEMIAEGAIPLRADAAVTQGELMRQEQEAGLIATTQTQHTSSRSLTGKDEDGEKSSPPPEEVPHARGPSVLGVEDLGLQDGRGVEMVLSDVDNRSQAEGLGLRNPHAPESGAPYASKDNGAEAETVKDAATNEDDDIILDDAAPASAANSLDDPNSESKNDDSISQ